MALRHQKHGETHLSRSTGWLRAAVLGANDGIVSTASLLMGIAASPAEGKTIVLSGVAGLVAGAMSMAAGEYVSVSSQADTEHADIEREKKELAEDEVAEHAELAAIYVKRGLSKELASQVSEQLMKTNALDAHLRDELGITDATVAKPVQAALASAASFASGALVPLIVAIVIPRAFALVGIGGASLLALAIAGTLAARAGGSNVRTAVIRVVFWGALAMAFTAGVGALFGVATS